MKDTLNAVDLLKIIWKNIVLIVICIILIAGLGFGFAKYKNKNVQYEASRDVVLYHDNKDQQGQYGQYTRDMGMMKTYQRIATDDIVLSKVNRQMKKIKNYNDSTKSLKDKITAEIQDQTTIITLSATDQNKKVAEKLVNETSQVYKEELKKTINVGEVKLLAPATSSSVKVPDGLPAKKVALLGAIFGGLLGILIAWIKDIFVKKLY